MKYLLFLMLILIPFTIPASQASQCFKDCHADNKLYVLLRNAEGFSPVYYYDSAGVKTLCFGHAVKKGERFSTPLTGEQCEAILHEDVGRTEDRVNELVKVPLYINQHNSLTDFAFNLGTGALQKSTLLKRVNAGQHGEVPPQFMRYIYAGGKPQRGLQIRRRLEASLYKNTP